MYGKTIEMFLVDGNAEGTVTAELSNWSGKAIKIPRTEVRSCTRDDIEGVGVYFLFCQDEDGYESVYIGEAENVLGRLEQHLRDYNSQKEEYYWTTAVIFVGRDLNKALIRYLERRLVEIAKECGRYRVLTKNTFSTTLKESQIASMEEFIGNVKVLLSALNFRLLTPTPKASTNTEYLYCKGNGGNGEGFVSPNGFTVLADTRVSDHVADSFKTHGKTYLRLREKLVSEGIIKEGIFTQDYEFSAPSAASSVILGRTSNGNLAWKNENGTLLRDL